jgi:hypothetical protein
VSRNLAISVVHRLPDDPPPATLCTVVLTYRRDGTTVTQWADDYAEGLWHPDVVAWSELPVLPAEPVTTEDVEEGAGACEALAYAVDRGYGDGHLDAPGLRLSARRLRAALPREEET